MKEINQILKVSEEEVCNDSRLEHLSNQFYTAIPHNISKDSEEAQKQVIRTLALLQSKQELLQLMRDMLAVRNTWYALLHLLIQ